MNLSLKLELPSDPRVLTVIRAAVRQFAALHGFSDAECSAITVGVDEALTNIIRHAYDNCHDQTILLSCTEDQQALIFVLEDQGRPADPERIKGRALDDVRPGGLGTHLMRETMDQVEYQRLPNRNRLRLVKFLEKKPSEEAS